MTDDKKKFNQLRGARVREVRKRAGLTQAELAEIIHCEPNYISMIERGDRGLTLDNAERIAKACSVRSDYLLLRSDYKTTSEEFSNTYSKFVNQRQLSIKLFEMVLLSKGYEIIWSDEMSGGKGSKIPRECTVKDSAGYEAVINVHEVLYPLFSTYERHLVCDIQHLIDEETMKKEDGEYYRELREEEQKNG